eukprot:363952-Chlamydomonas_euryale.AAC.8
MDFNWGHQDLHMHAGLLACQAKGCLPQLPLPCNSRRAHAGRPDGLPSEGSEAPCCALHATADVHMQAGLPDCQAKAPRPPVVPSMQQQTCTCRQACRTAKRTLRGPLLFPPCNSRHAHAGKPAGLPSEGSEAPCCPLHATAARSTVQCAAAHRSSHSTSLAREATLVRPTCVPYPAHQQNVDTCTTVRAC